MRRFGLALSVVVGLGIIAVAACSVETKASDVICVADQSNICTDCPKKDPSDTAVYAGRHVCAHDGKSFGKCEQCVVQTTGTSVQPVPIPTGDDDDDTDGGKLPTPPDKIDATCQNKLGVVASKDDPADQFLYFATYGGSAFQLYSSTGTPMRGPAAAIANGSSVLVVYRSKGDALISTTWNKDGPGIWSQPGTIAGSTTNGEPSIISWDGKIKLVYREADGFHHVANYDPQTSKWIDGVEKLFAPADADAGPPVNNISDPSAAAVGTPPLAFAMIVIGFTDTDKDIGREEFRNNAWKIVKSNSVQAAPVRPDIIPMRSGKFDLLSMFVNSAGELHVSTRTSQDNGYAWSPDTVTSDKAKPIEAVNGVGLPNGRALVVFRDADKKGQYMVFDPAATPPWTDPKPLVDEDNPVLESTPQLVIDPCGADAALAIATTKGVGVMRFTNDAWKGPYPVPGIPAATYATIVATP